LSSARLRRRGRCDGIFGRGHRMTHVGHALLSFASTPAGHSRISFASTPVGWRSGWWCSVAQMLRITTRHLHHLRADFD
jgi:hypothetical protein